MKRYCRFCLFRSIGLSHPFHLKFQNTKGNRRFCPAPGRRAPAGRREARRAAWQILTGVFAGTRLERTGSEKAGPGRGFSRRCGQPRQTAAPPSQLCRAAEKRPAAQKKGGAQPLFLPGPAGRFTGICPRLLSGCPGNGPCPYRRPPLHFWAGLPGRRRSRRPWPRQKIRRRC